MKMNSLNKKNFQKFTENHNNNALPVKIELSKDTNKILVNYNEYSKHTFQPRRLLSNIGSNYGVSNSKKNINNNISDVVKNNMKTIHHFPLTLKLNCQNQQKNDKKDTNIINKNYKKTIDENDLTKRKIHLLINNTFNNDYQNNNKILIKQN